MKTYSFALLTSRPNSGRLESEGGGIERPNSIEQKGAVHLLVPVWRVLARDAVRMVWTVRSTHDDLSDAQQAAEALQHHDPRLRVRVKPATKSIVEIKPPVVNGTTHFRREVAYRMSDLADAKKYYKSPG
jgi:hypothetical protein